MVLELCMSCGDLFTKEEEEEVAYFCPACEQWFQAHPNHCSACQKPFAERLASHAGHP